MKDRDWSTTVKMDEQEEETKPRMDESEKWKKWKEDGWKIYT
jgi:hypothetical protein